MDSGVATRERSALTGTVARHQEAERYGIIRCTGREECNAGSYTRPTLSNMDIPDGVLVLPARDICPAMHLR